VTVQVAAFALVIQQAVSVAEIDLAGDVEHGRIILAWTPI
jgi:hypothetical protein